jgi:hypothetical protein
MASEFLPQKIATMRERFPRAIERVFTAAEMEARVPIPREHIFDFWEGYRLIVTCDEGNAGRRLLNVSGSWGLRCFCSRYVDPMVALHLFRQISGRTDEPEHRCGGEGGVVHLFFTVEPGGVAR